MTVRIKRLLDTANTALAEGRMQYAAALYAQLADWCPERSDVHRIHALVMEELGAHDAALKSIDRAIILEPENAEYHRNRGDIFVASGCLDEAMESYRHSLRLYPDNVDTMINLGNAIHRRNGPGEARDWYLKALAIDTGNVKAINNVGKTFFDENLPDKACQWYQRALLINPTYAEARFNHAAALLSLGDFEKGWREYEWRFQRKTAHRVYPHTLEGARWKGESLTGKRLLVHCEQGMGDVIQFCRYLPMVKALGGVLIVEAQRPLVPLLSALSHVDQVVAFDATEPPKVGYDLYIPLMSLPLLFQTRLDTIPNQVPYLFADPGKVSQWRSHPHHVGLHVGLVWAGSDADPQRACSFEQIRAWFSIPGIHFHSLQKGPAAHHAEQMTGTDNFTPIGHRLADFGDTAAVIESLDLVISVDTAVAHLAGAMGKPIWILLPVASDWRWQSKRTDSPWYPTARLFRQRKSGDWRSVVASVGAALENLVCRPEVFSAKANVSFSTRTSDQQPDALYSLGRKYLDSGAFEQAAEVFESATALFPQWDAAHFMLGRALHGLGHLKKAITAYSASTRLNPRLSAAYRNMGFAFHQTGDLRNSAASYEQALRLEPDQAAVLTNLGAVYNLLKKPDRAEACYRRAISIDPKYADTHYNLGNLYLNRGDLIEALECYSKTLQLDPSHIHALGNLGRTRHRLGQLDQAMACYEMALSKDSNQPRIRLNRAITLLLEGKWKAAWPEYEWRFKQPDWRRTYPHRLTGPRWQGEPYKGKTLLVHCEQGIGDALQFARFLPMVKSRGGKVIFQVRRELLNLLKTIQGVDEFIVLSSDAPPQVHYDLYVPLCSLAGIFDTTPEDIPNHVPYLFSDSHKTTAWRRRLKQNGMHIGLVWAGTDTYPERACSLRELAPLGRLANIRWIGLQKGPAAVQALPEHQPPGLIVDNWGEDFIDFGDTAAAVANLDLVISIDTSVAHLAGALGKPVWVMLPAVADWRWLLNRNDSPWYPSMRLFRQQRLREWEPVVKEIAACLRQLVGSATG